MRETSLTHRRHDETNPVETGYVVLFAEEGNEHYGDHVWTLKTDLPTVPEEVVAFAADFYEVDSDEARELVDPEDIVDNAAAWDDPEFVVAISEALYESLTLAETAGYRTQDGAVVIDPANVELDYSVENGW